MEASLSPFLSLMKEKEAKENQGIRDACQVVWVLQMRQRGSRQVAGDNNASEKSTRQTSLPSAEGLSLMKEKEAKENQGGRAACQVAGDNHALEKSTRLTAPLSISGFSLMREMEASLSPFLSLMKEKEAKENQGLTEAGEVAGDNYALEKSTRLTASLSVWGFFLMREMEAPLSPFLALMQEKEAKENQGIRDACQVCRIP